MDGIIAFANESPWLAFFMFWVAARAVTAPFTCALNAYNRYLRSKNIQAHGYPTMPNMDADGDIVHPKIGDDE